MKHTFLLALIVLIASSVLAQTPMPESVKNYAANINDNGKSLEPNDFAFGTAIVEGTLYGLDTKSLNQNNMPKITVEISDPFRDFFQHYSATIDETCHYEIRVPMTMKHQLVWFMLDKKSVRQMVISAGRRVVVDYDMTEQSNNLIPYYSGENADINFALTDGFVEKFDVDIFKGKDETVAKFTAAQYKDFVLKAYHDYLKRIDTKNVTKRAKELLTLELKCQCAVTLAAMRRNVESAYRNAHHIHGDEPIPGFVHPAFDAAYLDYPQLLGIDDVMMLYSRFFGYIVSTWNICYERVFYKYDWEDELVPLLQKLWLELPSKEKLTKAEKPLAAVIAQKIADNDESRTDEERIFEEKYEEIIENKVDALAEKCAVGADEFLEKFFGKDGSYFEDFTNLQGLGLSYYFGRQQVVPDSVVAEIEQMRFPFYAEYIKRKNAEIIAQKVADTRKDYYLHILGESVGDSLLVELLKGSHGKVVFIDFWNTWCVGCRRAIKIMEPMKNDFDGKDVDFLYIADETSPQDEYDKAITPMKGGHCRLTENEYQSLLQKFGFTGIPSYVIIGRDGMVKDTHIGFRGADYYKKKIEEALEN